MTDEETQETMLKVASDAAMAVSVAIGGCTEGFDHDPEQVELLLCEALEKLLGEIADPVECSGSRAQLRSSVAAHLEELRG